jgi:hypothetical protein
MNYVEAFRSEVAKELPGLPDALLDMYTLLGLRFDELVNEEDVHDAWSVWKNTIDPKHKSLIPFEELSLEVQQLDTKYVEGIVRAVHTALDNSATS